MKGLVLDCLQDLVCGNFGESTWHEVLGQHGLPQDKRFARDDDVADELVMGLFSTTCELGGMTFEQACEVFGHFWVSRYIPKHFPELYAGVTSAQQLLLKLDAIHAEVRRRIPNALPPSHTCEWEGDQVLLMGYTSARPLMQLFIGSVRGVAKHFGQSLRATQVNNHLVRIEFAT
jgi:hypothetical protein